MRIGILGAGTWGYCLAYLLASKGHKTISWARDEDLINHLKTHPEHPHLPGSSVLENMSFTPNIQEALDGIDLLVESVTSAGLRPVFEQIKNISIPHCPIVITSKGIEQNTGNILPTVLCSVLGKDVRQQVTCLSGPSYATEVIQELPTSVVLSGYDTLLMRKLCDVFTTQFFRVYPNSDIVGVSYGGALKNIIAIACGISDGMGMGYSAKAALMTRGLHEMTKLAVANGAKPETLYGLSGMGDLCVTCSSLISRNCRFGYLIAKEQISPEEVQKKIGMVVEGAYTCVSALQQSKSKRDDTAIPMPITKVVYQIIYEGLPLKEAVRRLMERTIKEEHL
jgi:glycerol-3-phosphate dehydrogenase (NAD(P)+)